MIFKLFITILLCTIILMLINITKMNFELPIKLERCEVELKVYKKEVDGSLRPNWNDIEGVE